MTWKKGNRLRFVSEDAADPVTREVLSDIRQTLGLPLLTIFYPALAAYPEFLRLHWAMMRPAVSTGNFFACGDRLRADAYTRAHNYLRIPDLCSRLEDASLSQAARQELASALDLFHYSNPLLLLLFAAQIQALEGPVGENKETVRRPPLPIFSEKPLLVIEENASAAVRRRYDEIRRVLDLPYVNSAFAAMARYPDFLQLYWELLKSILQSPVYQQAEYAIRDSAWNLARELPGPMELSIDQLLEAGMKQEDISSVARILDLFVRNLSGMVINVAIAKIALEGGNMAAVAHEEKSGSEQVA